MNSSGVSYFPVADGIGIHAPPEARALIQEIWEEDRYLRHARLAPGDVVLDIGANVGVFSLLAARRGATVLAIEPNPRSFALLERNIQHNGFGRLVIPMNSAVADRSGVVELAIPETTRLYSLGSATTSAATIRQLESMPDLTLRKVTVGCAPLGEIISRELPEGAAIGFLKMDCEGAEWAVLQSLDRALAGRIRNMAMETHPGYAEIDLIHRLEALGYRITGFEQRSGRFQTGFVYATLADAPECPPPAKGAFAVLEGPKHAIAGAVAVLSSEGSFCLPLGSGSFSREWSIDGTPAGAERDIRVESPAPGIRSIALRVASGSGMGRAESTLVVLEEAYAESGRKACVLAAREAARIAVEGSSAFRIPAEALPGDWAIDGVVVSLKRARNLEPGGGLRLRFLGKVFEIGEGYSETTLAFPCNSLDVVFALEAETWVQVDISWWPHREKEAAAASEPVQDALSGTYALPGPSLESILVPNGPMRFRIGSESLPTAWTPTLLKVGISSLPGREPRAPQLSGHLGFRGHCFDLSGWYTEAILRDFSVDEDTIFEIHAASAEKLKIVWWVE